MLAYVKENNVKSAAVIGGGLLGLEAAKAVADMKVESHIIEFAPILMCRQVSFIVSVIISQSVCKRDSLIPSFFISYILLFYID